MADDIDRDVLERFVRGDEDAFEALFRRFEREVFVWILRIVRDPVAAEDALVEAFWRAYRGRARFDASRSFGAWMRRIATNAALDQLPALPRRTLAAAECVPPDAAAGAASAERLRRSVQDAFERLPPKLRVVATLALVEGESYASIADALDLPVGTVKSRVSRATHTLKRELARMGVRS